MDIPISAERLSELIGLIYDCAIDPARWPVAMEAIRTELDFHNATIDLIQLPSGKALTNIVTNIAPHYRAMMAGAGPDVIEQWGGEQVARNMPLDEPAVLSQANPAFNGETTTNRYYVTFARPQGIIDVMAIGLARDERAIGTLSFGRHRDAGPIGTREITIARLLVPHLQRATTINRMIEYAAPVEGAASATIDALSMPIVLLDASGAIVHANPAATQALTRGTLVHAANNRIEAATVGASRALAAALRQSTVAKSGIARRGVGIPVFGRDGSVGALHLLPLRARLANAEGGAIAALFVTQTDTPVVAPTEIATALFDLTPTEARIFAYLVTGHTQSKTATALGIERSTVKTHLVRLYDKIGVRRQVALVQVAASLAVPVIE